MNISTRGNLNGESGDLTFTVGGMDCGSCAAKIETAMDAIVLWNEFALVESLNATVAGWTSVAQAAAMCCA